MDGVEGGVLDIEAQLRCKSDGAHHAQRVVAEGDVGVERCAYDAVVQVLDAAKGVNQIAIGVVVQRYCHGVDGEVAAILVVLQGAVFHNGFPAVKPVALPSGPHKLYLPVDVVVVIDKGGGAEVFEYRHFDAGIDGAGGSTCQVDAVPHAYDVDVGAVALQEVVAHHPPHGIGLHAHGIGSVPHNLVYRVI